MTALLLAATFILGTNSISTIPKDERPAYTCYTVAENAWNLVEENSPNAVGDLQRTYNNFAKCATVAIETGRKLPSGQPMPWMAEYFASTVGAMYAQLQLSVADSAGKCLHWNLANDLAEQALLALPGSASVDPGMEDFLLNIRAGVKDKLRSCAV